MSGCGGLPRVFPHLSQVSPLRRCNFHSLKACLEACLEACLILAKCLFCSTFYSINGTFHSLEACLILAKSLLCCNFHSLEACLEACLAACLLAKCLFCSTFHRIHGNVHSLEACLPRGLPRGLPHPSQVSVLLLFLSHLWQCP